MRLAALAVNSIMHRYIIQQLNKVQLKISLVSLPHQDDDDDDDEETFILK